MARYDVSLADERGAVRADQHRDWSDFRARGGNPHFEARRATAWREPAELRGYRGGAAGSYGMGEDHERVRGTEREEQLRAAGRARLGGGGSGGFRDPGFRNQAAGYERDYEPIGPYHPLAREVRRENADLVRDYLRREARPGARGRYGADLSRRGGRYDVQGWRGGYGTAFDIGAGRGASLGRGRAAVRGGEPGRGYRESAARSDPYDIGFRNFRGGR